MGYDGKYGRVTTEFGDIGEDEPVIVFRAQDALLPQVLHYYIDLCRAAGSPTFHIDLVKKTYRTVVQWQMEHPHHVPRSRGPAGNRAAANFDPDDVWAPPSEV